MIVPVIERRIEDIDELFNDGEHIIYVNGADKNSATELGKLMHDFFCTNPSDMHFKQLADKVRYFKEDEKAAESIIKSNDKACRKLCALSSINRLNQAIFSQ